MSNLDAVQIRSYHPDDKPNCIVLFKTNVPDFFTVDEIDQFENWLNDMDKEVSSGKVFHSNYYFVVISQQVIVGSGGFGYNKDNNQCTMAWGFVNKQYHKKGFGKMLFEHRLEQIRKLYPAASVILDTTQFSYTFFEKYGFIVVKFTKDGYTAGIHRYDMKLESI